MKLKNILFSVFNNRCPRCHQGKVFVKDNPYHLKHLFKMEDHCPVCGEKYEKEPGYFYGAMFVSYTFTAILFFMVLVSDFMFFHLGLDLLYFLVPGVLLLSPLTFQWSRLIWLNFFIRYDQSMDTKTVHPESEKS